MNQPDTPAIVLFEDDAVGELGPIAATRPAFEIRCGALNLRERIELGRSGSVVYAVVRPELERLTPGLVPILGAGVLPAESPVVAVNAQLWSDVESLRTAIAALDAGDEVRRDGRLWLARTDAGGVAERIVRGGPDRGDADRLELIDRPWRFVSRGDTAIEVDAAWLAAREAPARRIFAVEFASGSARPRALAPEAWVDAAAAFPGAIVIEADKVLAAASARVRPGAVIDAAGGPVVLSPGVVVHPLSVVVGPAYLGPGTVVNPGAKLREGTSLGAFCKVGGEIEESIVLDLSNKQHDGFLGHALVGSWVNLGADTNGSDLKNNYGSVRVDLGWGSIDTGETFVGQHLGDHVKTGIDTMLTTGGVVGVAGNVFGGGFAPRFVPAFGWGGPEGITEYRWEDAVRTARTVLARRDVVWTADYERLLHHVFESTAAQRAG